MEGLLGPREGDYRPRSQRIGARPPGNPEAPEAVARPAQCSVTQFPADHLGIRTGGGGETVPHTRTLKQLCGSAFQGSIFTQEAKRLAQT